MPDQIMSVYLHMVRFGESHQPIKTREIKLALFRLKPAELGLVLRREHVEFAAERLREQRIIKMGTVNGCANVNVILIGQFAQGRAGTGLGVCSECERDQRDGKEGKIAYQAR